MTTGIKIPVSGDVSDLDRAMDRAESSMESAARTADRAGSRIDSSFESAADGADTMASKSSQAAGALGDLGGVVADGLGFPGLGAAMENAGMWAQGLAGAGDALNLVTESTIVKNLASKASTVAKTVAEKAAAAASKAAAAAQWALNAAMSANPIMLVVIAIAALVAGFVIAYKNSETFRAIVDKAFAGVKAAAGAVVGFFTTKVPAAFSKITGAAGKVMGWVRGNWPKILAILTGPIGLAVLVIAKNWDKIRAGAGAVKEFITTKFDAVVTFFTRMPGRMTKAVGGLFNGLKDAFRDAVNFVIDKWNSFELKIKLPKIAGGGSIGIETPNIPRLAKGGIVTGPTLALIGEGQHSEAVIPLDGRAMGGNSYRITVTAPVGASPVDIGRELVRCIDAYETKGGRRRA